MQPIVLLSESQIKVMFDLQHKCNQLLIAPDYLENTPENVDFALAADKEFFESLDHLSYKWWKKDSDNLDQVALEMVDVIHFGISHTILSHANNENAKALFKQPADMLIKHLEQKSDTIMEIVQRAQEIAAENSLSPDQTVLNLITAYREDFINSHVGDKIVLACVIAYFCIYNANEIFNLYVAKNALNIFRAQNGYKDGSYIKMWNGMEDNKYVETYVASHDMSQPDAVDLLNAYLTTEYALVKASA